MEERQVVSLERYQYSLLQDSGGAYSIRVQDTVTHRSLSHGPFSYDEAMAFLAQRTLRCQELQR